MSLDETQRYWDTAAASFDEEADHGLHDPIAQMAWTALLKKCLPSPPAQILDVGCGTGSLSVLMTGLGHEVTGVDLSPAMIQLAQAKAVAAGYTIPFRLMDAANLQFQPHSFDGIVCRHLLWTLPEPAQVLARWANLLRPDGRLVLIEGFWETGAGLHADELAAALPRSFTGISIQNLSDQSDYWGKHVTDERYALTAVHHNLLK